MLKKLWVEGEKNDTNHLFSYPNEKYIEVFS